MLQRSPQRRKSAPSLCSGVDIFSKSALGREIVAFSSAYSQNMFLEASKSKSPQSPGMLTQPAGVLQGGVINEQSIMAQFGFYWEPLLWDLAYFEQMRDNISLLAGNYSKFIDLLMSGFELTCEDPKNNQKLYELLVGHPLVDFYQVARCAAGQLATIGNAYYAPTFGLDDDGKRIVTFRPIRAAYMRKLRDYDLRLRGFVQLLHRPSEFMGMGSKIHQTQPTFYLSKDICCGSAYADHWDAYGKPPLGSLPFMAKMKLQMERDLVEMLHQHVPRVDVTYTPEEMMSEEQVEAAVQNVRKQVSSLSPTDSYVHTPDYTFQYQGPQGKALDGSSFSDHVMLQIYAVLPLGPGLMGSDVTMNPIATQQQFRLTCALIDHLRGRVELMLDKPVQQIADENGLGKVSWNWKELDAETAEVETRTDEYRIQNAALSRDSGFSDQNTAAKHATKNFPGGPVRKAAAPGQLPPPVDPNKNSSGAAPSDKPKGKSKVGDSKKGPKDKNRSAPTPDKRPRKRHEQAEDQMQSDVASLTAFLSEEQK